MSTNERERRMMFKHRKVFVVIIPNISKDHHCPFSTKCIRELDWTLVKVVPWLIFVSLLTTIIMSNNFLKRSVNPWNWLEPKIKQLWPSHACPNPWYTWDKSQHDIKHNNLTNETNWRNCTEECCVDLDWAIQDNYFCVTFDHVFTKTILRAHGPYLILD